MDCEVLHHGIFANLTASFFKNTLWEDAMNTDHIFPRNPLARLSLVATDSELEDFQINPCIMEEGTPHNDATVAGPESDDEEIPEMSIISLPGKDRRGSIFYKDEPSIRS